MIKLVSLIMSMVHFRIGHKCAVEYTHFPLNGLPNILSLTPKSDPFEHHLKDVRNLKNIIDMDERNTFQVCL